MRNTNAKTGAHAVKQGAILFLCAIIIAACVFGIWKIVSADQSDVQSVSTPSEPIATVLPTDTPKPTMLPTQKATAAPTIVPTAEIVMANPLDENNPSNVSGKSEAATPSEPMIGESVQLPLAGLIIGIDPGHQSRGNSEREPVAPGSSETKAKVSSGTQGVVSRVPEYETNLVISLQLRDELQALGAQVVMTRTENDVDISNIERAQLCNAAGADVVLRIHCNGSSNASAQGIGLYVTATGDISEESYAIADVLIDAMVEATGAEKDGIFRRDTYSGLNWSEVPAILVEMGFMSNPEEDRKLQDPEYQAKMVAGMVDGIAQYFERDLLRE